MYAPRYSWPPSLPRGPPSLASLRFAAKDGAVSCQDVNPYSAEAQAILEDGEQDPSEQPAAQDEVGSQAACGSIVSLGEHEMEGFHGGPSDPYAEQAEGGPSEGGGGSIVLERQAHAEECVQGGWQSSLACRVFTAAAIPRGSKL